MDRVWGQEDVADRAAWRELRPLLAAAERHARVVRLGRGPTLRSEFPWLARLLGQAVPPPQVWRARVEDRGMSAGPPPVEER